MNSDSESNDEISDQQLDALLRQIQTPADLKQKLLSVVDSEPVQLERSSKALPWKRLLALAAAVAGVALFLLWPLTNENPNGNLANKTTKTQPASAETVAEVDQLLAEIELLEGELDSLQDRSNVNRIDQLLAASERQSRLPNEEVISTVLAIADQTPVILGTSPESTIKDMENIIETWPETRGAVIAQEFIDQNQLNQKDKS